MDVKMEPQKVDQQQTDCIEFYFVSILDTTGCGKTNLMAFSIRESKWNR